MAVNPKSLANLRPSKPGEVRNPTGRPVEGKAIMRQLLAEMTDTGESAGAQIARVQIERAKKGDLDAAAFIWSYAFGRPGQSLDVSVTNKADEIAAMFPTPEELENALRADNT